MTREQHYCQKRFHPFNIDELKHYIWERHRIIQIDAEMNMNNIHAIKSIEQSKKWLKAYQQRLAELEATQ